MNETDDRTESPPTDNYIGLTKAAKLMRGRGKHGPSLVSLRRWANPKRGCQVDGAVVVLRTCRINGYLCTTATWVEDFEAERIRLGTRGGETAPRVEPSPRSRAASHRRAKERLAKDGIGVSRP